MGADDLTTLVFAIVELDSRSSAVRQRRASAAGLIVPGSHARLPRRRLPGAGDRRGLRSDEIVVDFPPGATLALYTDGLVERRGEGIEKGTAPAGSGARRREGRPRRRRGVAVVDACTAEDVDDDVTALFVRAEPALGPTCASRSCPTPTRWPPCGACCAAGWTRPAPRPTSVHDLVMAANEAWQNALEHGHGFQPVPVSVRFTREADAVVVTVRDAGGRGLPAGDPDRGRGIELMKALVGDVRLDLGSRRGGVAALRHKIRAPAPVGPEPGSGTRAA